MCDACGNGTVPPEVVAERIQQMLDRENQLIADGKHGVRYIFGDETSTAFCYTVGLTAQGLPELIITGAIEPQLGMSILNHAATVGLTLADDQTISRKVLIADGDNSAIPVRLMQVDPELANMHGATQRWPHTTALQIVFPDEKGLFPGEPGCRYSEDDQPALAVWRG